MRNRRPFSFRLVMLAVACLAAAGCGQVVWDGQASGFRPLEPPLTLTAAPLQVRYEPVDTLTPTLRWEPFPGVRQCVQTGRSHQECRTSDVPFVEVDPELVSNVSYEVGIWETSDGERGPRVYRATDVPTNGLRVTSPLEPATAYFWSVRAGYDLAGERQTTEWSMSLDPYPAAEAAELDPATTAPEDEALRDFVAKYRRLEEPTARDVARRLGRIPNVNFYRFRTPG